MAAIPHHDTSIRNLCDVNFAGLLLPVLGLKRTLARPNHTNHSTFATMKDPAAGPAHRAEQQPTPNEEV